MNLQKALYKRLHTIRKIGVVQILSKLRKYATYMTRYLMLQYLQIKLATLVSVEHFKDLASIMTSSEYRKNLHYQFLHQLNGTKEVDHEKRNSLIDYTQYSYVDIFGNLCTYVEADQEEHVYFIDGVVEQFTPFDYENGTNIIYFYQANE